MYSLMEQLKRWVVLSFNLKHICKWSVVSILAMCKNCIANLCLFCSFCENCVKTQKWRVAMFLACYFSAAYAYTHIRAHAHTLLSTHITTIIVIKYAHCYINSITYSICTNIWRIFARPITRGVMICVRSTSRPWIKDSRMQTVPLFCSACHPTSWWMAFCALKLK